MTTPARRPWLEALQAAGVVPTSYVPDASLGRGGAAPDEVAVADLAEDTEVTAHAVARDVSPPEGVAFLDGIQHWRVMGQSGIVPVVLAYVAAAVRRRARDRRLRTVAERSREFVVTCLEALSGEQRRILEESGVGVEDLPVVELGQPARTLRAARVRVDRARETVERELGEACAAGLGDGDWLVVDGLLSESEALARHPRTLGVIKSHGTQFFAGRDLERALTLPDGHRTSVFQPRRHAHQPVHSWYLRLWPWEGNDLLYGLLRIEARAHADTVRRASGVSGWLLRERAPLSTPDARWDRLLYPIHDVESYLRSRVPQDLRPAPAARLPRTGS